MPERQLNIQLNGYWHSGSGQSGGTYLDAVMEKDAGELPFVAGRQLKGLLRDALRRAAAWGWPLGQVLAGPAATLEELLFGSATQSLQRDHTLPGMMFFSDAVLCADEQHWLQHNPQLTSHLYQPLYSTAINDKGSAQTGSLRGIEVCVPLTLHAHLNLAITTAQVAHREQQASWLARADRWHWLPQCLPLIDAVGAHRSRGFGEAVLSLQPSQED